MIFRLSAILTFLCLATVAAMAAPSDRTQATGTFTDSSGTAHSWSVNDDHCLFWEGKPYIPAGAVFQSRFLSGVTTSENWHDDLEELAQFKKHHVMNILVEPMGPPGSLLETPQSAVQALIDVLDSQGFNYGFAFEGSPSKTWNATLIHPAIYRDPAPPTGATVTFRNIPNIVSADYFLVSTVDDAIMSRGQATTRDDSAIVNLKEGEGGDGTVLLLFPETRMTEGADSQGLPNIWAGADDFRDSLLLYFSQIKYGKGLRFFLDPIRVRGDLEAATEGGMIPDDDDYRLGFQTWLMKKYRRSRVQLDDAWGVKNDDLTDFAVAARCKPLWYQSKGISLLFDPTTGTTYEITPSQSNLWADINTFETLEIQRAMNEVADAIKQGIANVPVIYRWTQASQTFVNAGPSGFDGLWVEPHVHGSDIISTCGGYAFAAVEQAHRPQWLVAGLEPVVAAGAAPQLTSDRIDPAKAQFKRDRVTLDEIGCKGVFIAPPDGAQWTDEEARWLDWTQAVQADYDIGADQISSTKPAVLFYPTNISLPGASIEALGDSIWWLPTFSQGALLDIGDGLEGYALGRPGEAPTFVIYATSGAPVVKSFRFPPTSNIVAQSPAGLPAPMTEHHAITTLTFTQTPTVITGTSAVPLPERAAEDAMTVALKLCTDCERQHIPTDQFTERLTFIKDNLLMSDNPTAGEQVAYDNIRLVIAELRSVISPYVWIEGEAASTNNFDGVVSSDTASQHAFLWVDTTREPPSGSSGVYKATYNISVNATSEYTVWAAIAPGAPGTTGVSDVSMAADDGTPVIDDHPETSGDPYGTLPVPTSLGSLGKFVWCNLGTVQLDIGPHTLIIALTGRAPVTNRYTLGIDAICIARAPFHPDGTRQPRFEDADSTTTQPPPSNASGHQGKQKPEAIAVPDDTPIGTPF